MKSLLLSLLLIVSAMPSSPAATTASSNTSRATRVIHFDASPAKRLEIFDRIAGGVPSAIINNASAMIGVDKETTAKMISISVLPGENQIIIDANLGIPYDASHGYETYCASEVADMAAQILIDSLTPTTEGDLKLLLQKRDDLTAKKQELIANLHDLENQLRSRSGAVDDSPDTIHQLLASLQMQRESLSLDLVAKQARVEALTDQIAKFSDQLAKKVQDDPVAKELEKVVDLREKALEHTRGEQATGVVPMTDVDKAATDLAESRAKLLERKSLAASTAGGDTLANWNRDLMNLSVDQADLKARLKAINERLDRLANAGDMLDRGEQVRAQMTLLEKQLADANARIADLQFQAQHDHVDFKILTDKSTNEPAPATQPAK